MFKLVLDMTPAEINRLLQEQYEEMDRKTLEQFKLVLAEALRIQRAKMRMDGGYDDQTGQLRSSTGGIIYRNGVILYQDFELSPYGSDKSPGMDNGMEKALVELKSLRSSGESSGWGIILVAGMEYASWVEAKGLTVLTMAASEVEKSLEEAFNRISV